MAIKHSRFRGKIKIKGRPREQAKAEIMIMKAEERAKDKSRRRFLFTILDLIMITSFGFAIYFTYLSEFLKGLLFLLIGSLPLAYFILRRVLKNKKRR